jgi:plasmid stabilization system protein ParE
VSFSVRLTREALEDLQRLEEFLVEAAVQHGDFDLPLRAVEAIRRELRVLESNPYTCRKVSGSSPLERELVIPFGGSGYVALFEILSEDEVAVSAIRHQREDDYH